MKSFVKKKEFISKEVCLTEKIFTDNINFYMKRVFFDKKIVHVPIQNYIPQFHVLV